MKHIVHVTSYNSLVNDTDDYKISYDIKTLVRDIDVEDMFQGEQMEGTRCTYLLQVIMTMSRLYSLMLC